MGFFFHGCLISEQYPEWYERMLRGIWAFICIWLMGVYGLSVCSWYERSLLYKSGWRWWPLKPSECYNQNTKWHDRDYRAFVIKKKPQIWSPQFTIWPDSIISSLVMQKFWLFLLLNQDTETYELYIALEVRFHFEFGSVCFGVRFSWSTVTPIGFLRFHITPLMLVRFTLC